MGNIQSLNELSAERQIAFFMVALFPSRKSYVDNFRRDGWPCHAQVTERGERVNWKERRERAREGRERGREKEREESKYASSITFINNALEHGNQ